MAITITVVDDTIHTANVSKSIISRDLEVGEALTVVVPPSLYQTGWVGVILFEDANGIPYVYSNNWNGFDYSSGSFQHVLTYKDKLISCDGSINLQIALMNAKPSLATSVWRSKIINARVDQSIIA